MDSRRIAAVRSVHRTRFLILLVTALWAAEPIAVDAWVSDDLRVITGTVTVPDTLGDLVRHPLRELPGAPDDLTLLRTWPGREDRGEGTLTRTGPGTFTFRTELPRRFGDVGATRRGTFANGWWVPQPIDDDLVVMDWTVTLHLPEGATAALGSVVGEGTVTWTNTSDRVGLAIVRDGVLTPVDSGVSILSQGPPKRRIVRELTATLDAMFEPVEGVVVVAPLRRRLARPSHGLVYISDRAFRVTPPLPRFHRVGVARSLFTGLTDLPDDFSRSLAGAGLAREYVGSLKGASARRMLGIFSFLPSIDFILYDRTLPFYGDVFETAFPTDPIQDDLSEVFDPHIPGPAAMAQLADLGLDASVSDFVDALQAGQTPAEAAGSSGVPVPLVLGWNARYPVQDYDLTVLRDAIVVERTAPDSAPSEVITVRRDKETVARIMPPGPGTWTLPRSGARRVRLDPARHTEQASRLGDAYPQRFRVTVSGGISTINLTEGWVSAGAGAFLRRQGDNRNTGAVGVSTSRDTLAVGSLAYTHRFGPELSGLSRRHRVTISTATALQNQRFADDDDPPVTVSAGLGWSWSNRQAGLFPLRGWRLSAGASGGFAPGTSQRWTSISTTAVRLVPLHPRIVWASRGTVGLAKSDIRGRLLSLGGPGAVGGVAYGGAFGSSRAALTTELRVVPLRNLSVPMLLLWGSELQLSAGVDVGTIGTPDGAEHALGGTFGIAGVGDVFGADPYMLGVTVGVPLWWTDGVEVDRPWQLTLRWSQDF